MSVSNEEKEFVAYIVELMQAMGRVNARRMFGGHGIFLDGLMFGLVADSILYLKADHETEKKFTSRGLEAFSYLKKGIETRLSYFQAPEEALENMEEMTPWANMAYETPLKAANMKNRKTGITG